MSTALQTPPAGQQGVAEGLADPQWGLAVGLFGSGDAETAWAIERLTLTPRTTTTVYEPVGGRQGVAQGVDDADPFGLLSGTWGTADTMAAYGMQRLVERTVVSLVLGSTATGTGRVTSTVSVPVDLPITSTGTGRVTSAASVHMTFTATGTGTPRGVAAATVPTTVTCGSTGTPRGKASVTLPLTMRASASVMSTILASAAIALRLLTRGRVRLVGTRIRARDLSGPAYNMVDQSEGLP
jgi:hypothetical protein